MGTVAFSETSDVQNEDGDLMLCYGHLEKGRSVIFIEGVIVISSFEIIHEASNVFLLFLTSISYFQPDLKLSNVGC